MVKSIIKNKKILFLFIGIIFLICGFIINRQNSNDNNELRTEKEPILSRFPNLGIVEKCVWKVDVIGTDNRVTVPAPSSYRIRGYVFLNKSEIEKFKKQYKWGVVPNNWEPSLDESVLKLSSLQWSYSDECNNYIKPKCYISNFYIEFNHNIVYFEK